MKGFYKGWSSTILRDVPFSFIYWISYERLKIFYGKIWDEDITFSERLFSNIGAIANSQENILLKNGSENVPKNVPKASEHSILLTFLSGSTSGVLAALFTHPFDVLKTQQQLRASEQIIKNTNINNVNYCNYNYITNFHNVINSINNKNKDCIKNKMNLNINNLSESIHPIKYSKVIQNNEIFSSNNAYNVRMGVIEIEKIPHKNIFVNYFKERLQTITMNIRNQLNLNSNFNFSFRNNYNLNFDMGLNRLNYGETNTNTSKIKENLIKENVNNVYERDGLLRIFREKGIAGLFRGLNMRLLTVIPSSAIMVTVYEFVKKIDL